MTYFRSLLAQLVRDEEGQTAVEYGLVIALVCLVIVGALLTAVTGAMDSVTTAIGNAFA